MYNQSLLIQEEIQILKKFGAYQLINNQSIRRVNYNLITLLESIHTSMLRIWVC